MSCTKLFAGNADLTLIISHPSLQLEQFEERECEVMSKTKLFTQVFTYFIQKFVQGNSDLDGILNKALTEIYSTYSSLTG